MRIALINPEVPVSRVDFKGFIREPLGLLYVASVLESQGHKVKVLDLQIDPKLDVSREIDAYLPDIIGITSFTSNFPKALKVAKLLKDCSSAYMIFGGVHATFTYNELSQRPEFDAYVIGEGEFTMLELANSLEQGSDLSKIKGLAYKKDKKIIFTGTRKPFENLDEIPFPARHLIDINSYLDYEEKLALITTRGCPYSCIFCSTSKMHGPLYRQRSIENSMQEIKMLIRKYNPPLINFSDDNFTFSRSRVERFCQSFLEEGINTPWECNAHVADVDKELLEMMRRSGCKELFFGIESGSQQILNNLKKGFRLEMARVVLQWAKELGFETTVSFIIGLPGENKATISETMFFIKNIKDYVESIILTFITPFPGTLLSENLDELGYEIIDNDLSHYTLHYPVIKPKGLTNLDLQSAWIEGALLFSKRMS